ncbi:MAG: FkbM family methyltransferase [Pseudomonadota bacterium]
MAKYTLSEILPDYTDFGPISAKADALCGVYLGSNTVLTKIWSGHLMTVYTGDVIVTPHLINIGINEPHVTRTLVSLIRPGDVFVDVGANVGYFSVLGAWQSYPGGKVWAFEPNPNVYSILHGNMNTSGYSPLAKCRQIALSDRPGSASLRVFKGFEATSTIRDVPQQFIDHTREETGQESYLVDVEINTLDAEMRDVPEIDVMKIDVEGHEPSMIRGATEILSRSKTVKVVMEFVPPIMGDEQTGRLIQDLRQMGFAIYTIEHDFTFILQDDDRRLAAIPFADLLLIKRTH